MENEKREGRDYRHFSSDAVTPIYVYTKDNGDEVLVACVHNDERLLCSDAFACAVLRTMGYTYTMQLHWKEGRAYVEFPDVVPCIIALSQYFDCVLEDQDEDEPLHALTLEEVRLAHVAHRGFKTWFTKEAEAGLDRIESAYLRSVPVRKLCNSHKPGVE